MELLFLNMGTSEMILIVMAVLLLFGGKKMPELAKGLGQGIREFKTASDDLKRELNNNINSLNEEVDRAKYDIDRAFREAEQKALEERKTLEEQTNAKSI